jgi:hypothetical protein
MELLVEVGQVGVRLLTVLNYKTSLVIKKCAEIQRIFFDPF